MDTDVKKIIEIEELFTKWNNKNDFSGVFSVSGAAGLVFQNVSGYRNRPEQLPNTDSTAFGIASGTKLFTSLAICKLIDENRLSLYDKVWDILPDDLGMIDKRVTIHHLLTHTSGIGDYLDEEASDSYEKEQELCNQYPIYLWENLSFYLQMITPLPPKFEPGARFGYSNAGFIILGLVIEAITEYPYQEYVKSELIQQCGLVGTGFYRTNALPYNTALGYVLNKSTNKWESNIFKLPVIGGSDGGLFTCAKDLDTLWRALFAKQILSEGMLETFLSKQVKRESLYSYGLGVYRYGTEDKIVYYAVGSDFGVDFFTAYFPKIQTVVSALGNTEKSTWTLLKQLLSLY